MRSFGYFGKLSLLGVALALPACSRQPPPGPDFPQATVSGKVTYDGEPVRYGFVLFFRVDAIPDEGGEFSAVASAAIVDGSYEAVVPVALMKVCLVTDPDVDPGLLAGAYLRQGHGPPLKRQQVGKPEGPPGLPDPADGKEGPKGQEDPKGAFEKDAPHKKPPHKEGPEKEGPEGGPDMPDKNDPSARPNPLALHLSAHEMQVLREIHGRHGRFAQSTLIVAAEAGSNNYDIELQKE
jgi:hypothetical protein